MDRTKWAACVAAAFANGNLTRAYRDVLEVIRSYAGKGGAWPSHKTIACKVKCDPKTVKRALSDSRALGLIDWVSGGRWAVAGRWHRKSNRYQLLIPATPAEYGWRPKGHFALRTRKEEKRGTLRTVAEQLAALGVVVRAGVGTVAFRQAMGW